LKKNTPGLSATKLFFADEINQLSKEELLKTRNFAIENINKIGTYSSINRLGLQYKISSFEYLVLLEKRLKRIVLRKN
jgi:hypothetical protein